MVNIEKVLLDRFYQEFGIFSILFIIMILTTTTLLVFYSIHFSKMTRGIRITLPIVCLSLICLCVFSGFIVSKYYDDYAFLRTNSPVHITGKVIGYSNAVSDDDLTVTKSWPIILIDGTNEQVSLNIIASEEKLEIGQVYDFLYLPYTRIAELLPEE